MPVSYFMYDVDALSDDPSSLANRIMHLTSDVNATPGSYSPKPAQVDSSEDRGLPHAPGPYVQCKRSLAS